MVIRPETNEFEDLCHTCKRASEVDDDTGDSETEVIKEMYRPWQD